MAERKYKTAWDEYDRLPPEVIAQERAWRGELETYKGRDKLMHSRVRSKTRGAAGPLRWEWCVLKGYPVDYYAYQVERSTSAIVHSVLAYVRNPRHDAVIIAGHYERAKRNGL